MNELHRHRHASLHRCRPIDGARKEAAGALRRCARRASSAATRGVHRARWHAGHPAEGPSPAPSSSAERGAPPAGRRWWTIATSSAPRASSSSSSTSSGWKSCWAPASPRMRLLGSHGFSPPAGCGRDGEAESGSPAASHLQLVPEHQELDVPFVRRTTSRSKDVEKEEIRSENSMGPLQQRRAHAIGARRSANPGFRTLQA